MIFKLYVVSVASEVWKFALRISDKLGSNKWIALCYINFVLILITAFFPVYIVDVSSNSKTRTSIILDSSSSASSVETQISKLLITKYQSSSSDKLYFFYAGHGTFSPQPSELDLSESHNSPRNLSSLASTKKPFFLIGGVADYVQNPVRLESAVEDANYFKQMMASKFDYASILTSAGDSVILRDLLKQFLPIYAQQDKDCSIQSKGSFISQAVFYTPLIMCVVQFFTLILTFISLNRKWAEGIQIQLATEKLRLEIEILKEERDKNNPKIIIAQR